MLNYLALKPEENKDIKDKFAESKKMFDTSTNSGKKEQLQYMEDNKWNEMQKMIISDPNEILAEKSDTWKAYVERNQSELNSLAINFFTPIFNAPEGAKWGDIEKDMLTLTAKDMDFYFKDYETPAEMMSVLKIKKYDDMTFDKLEKYILFGMYKKQQFLNFHRDDKNYNK
ncbi:hypothetical protein [Aureibacter tunicatorum]|uniref:Uncharacterized protein n=1 Tax=Aureibacter tunicatorum TaxID=866807 RepID=A0AAE3XNT5_9BACT|nr:hypothetical protein [Aureibacter tunicatorum]MDR6239872.1 hypothetical protein [Aureibacter tunicatorum]BDD04347.1 hypothetical protein AUTU_18300 [Aureibacter tunicatorum]